MDMFWVQYRLYRKQCFGRENNPMTLASARFRVAQHHWEGRNLKYVLDSARFRKVEATSSADLIYVYPKCS